MSIKVRSQRKEKVKATSSRSATTAKYLTMNTLSNLLPKAERDSRRDLRALHSRDTDSGRAVLTMGTMEMANTRDHLREPSIIIISNDNDQYI